MRKPTRKLIVNLKDCLFAIKQEFEDLLEAVSVQREALEAELQEGLTFT